MNAVEAENVRVVRAYLAAVEAMATGDALARFYTADAVQIELPNQLNKGGGSSDLATLLKRAEQGKGFLRQQAYAVHSVVARDAVVAVEATWTAVLAIGFGTLAPGATMKAHFALFFELRDGRIFAQRNYDCFEPW